MSTNRGARSLDPSPDTRVSPVRTALAALLVVAGIVWVAYYTAAVATDGRPAAVGDLGDWNYLIGFGVLLLGLTIAAHPSTPLGRGRGVVVGMLGCFLLGLIWIVVYYVTNQDLSIPLIRELGNYNLLVGIGFMAVGFVYATRWE
ncbi:MAG: FIG018426: putative septation inhibitor protein [uncultured Nocardioidaceae bacterium]|uniref:Cell division protein CrgA n=1 Tax=uncultured Nocardioidaceae bacterium TaxID=253824 RepID=A0A6J4M9P1_9ACTN|nr:MAG: FIG018426: putative septation inhibitor protein [uncultured Nocardioidaceae bacterium]